MLNEIQDEKNISKYLKKARDKNDPFRLFGLDTEYTKIMILEQKLCKTCHEVLDLLGIKNNPLLSLAMKLEKLP